MAMKKYGYGGLVAGVTSGSEEWEATGRPFENERGRRLVPCRRVDDHSVTRDMPDSSFRLIPKTSRRVCNEPVEVGDLSGCGQMCAVGSPFRRGGSTYIDCVWLNKPDEVVAVQVGHFRRGSKTASHHGRNPIAFGEAYGGWHTSGYGEIRESDGAQLYAGTCEGCGFVSRRLEPGNLRKGQRHSCSQFRDHAGLTANGYTVVHKRWHKDSVHWVVRHIETGKEELWSPPRVEIDLVGDLGSLDSECAKAIRGAAFKGEDSPILREIGTTVAEVQFYLPKSHHTRGDALGHIFPRKMCLTPRTRVASWHPRLLRWIDKPKNSQMSSLAWLEMFADPVVVVASQELFAKCLEDLHRLYPDGYWGHKHGRGRITAKRRAVFGLPTREAEVAAWRREAAAFEAIYDGYDLTSESP
jgi:hypothetical protein